MKSHIRCVVRVLVAGYAVTQHLCVGAAELVFENTAIDKMLGQTLFKDEGRHHISRGACGTYLESPTTNLRDGRLWIRSHITARVGVPAGKVCVGPTLASWTVVSGVPVAQGGIVRLEDIKVEELEDAKIRFILKTGLAPAVPKAIELDVRKSVGSMLKATSPKIESDVELLRIDSVVAANDQLIVKFDFRLVAK